MPACQRATKGVSILERLIRRLSWIDEDKPRKKSATPASRYVHGPRRLLVDPLSAPLELEDVGMSTLAQSPNHSSKYLHGDAQRWWEQV
jgi:hypothetical protein